MDPLTVKYIGKFIGPDEIADVSLSNLKTPSGAEVFKVTLKSGKVRLMPERAMVGLVTDDAQDHNFIRNRRMFLMVPAVVQLMKEYDLPSQDVPHFATMLGYELDTYFGRATNWLRTKNDSLFVPGGDAVYDVSLLMAEQVISEIPKSDVTAE